MRSTSPRPRASASSSTAIRARARLEAAVAYREEVAEDEFAQREHISYPLLSDHGLALAEAMGLPTFETGGLKLYKRLTFVAEECRIVNVFYPVFPPDRNAADVLAWLQARPT